MDEPVVAGPAASLAENARRVNAVCDGSGGSGLNWQEVSTIADALMAEDRAILTALAT